MFTLFACSIFYVISDTKTEEGADKTAASSSGIAIYIDSGDGYELSSSSEFPTGSAYTLNTTYSTCTNGGAISQDSETNAINVSVSSSDYCSLYYDYNPLKLSDYVISLADTETTPDFSTTATTDEGVFVMEDDYGELSYYFRGAVENNYVYFAGYYWRIVRVNGDGTVRIIYDGSESAYANGIESDDRQIGESAYNSGNKYNAYVGYMYGTPASSSYIAEHANSNPSTIKDVLDTWYKDNLLNTTYEYYLADEIFCNDRSVYSGDGYSTSTYTYYSASNRLYTNKSPQLTCNQQNDAFTVDDATYGNGDLTYPIGLITADEVALAGGIMQTGSSQTNCTFYLYIGYSYWTMSPGSFVTYYNYANVYFVDTTGDIEGDYIITSRGVRPVINLKADVLISSGDGSASLPFVLTMD